MQSARDTHKNQGIECRNPRKPPAIPPAKRINDMGFSFNFFGTQEVRKFSYKPRFYDPETEERRKKYGDFTKPKETKYVPGQHVKGSFRDGNYQRTKEVSRNQKTIGIVTMVLLFAVVYLIFKYFPLLIDSLGK